MKHATQMSVLTCVHLRLSAEWNMLAEAADVAVGKQQSTRVGEWL